MSETACPTCGADGVTACVGLDGADHEGRPPYFDAKATAVLDSMAPSILPRADPMTTLTDFLLARIAEDEAVAEHEDGGLMTDARFSKARVLAECEAKRRIVELHYPHPEFDHRACVLCQWDVDCNSPMHDHQFYKGKRAEWPCETMLALAAPFASHPDFDEAWRA